MNLLEREEEMTEDVATCRVCGCTENDPCPGGCHWVLDPEGDLCSECATGMWAMPDGRVLHVDRGLGGTYMTFCANSRHRVKSPKLPVRNTREEAQADLDEYAIAKGGRRRLAVRRG